MILAHVHVQNDPAQLSDYVDDNFASSLQERFLFRILFHTNVDCHSI